MLKRVLNAELEKKVFEDEMMEKLSVVPAEYEVYEEYASRQEDFDRDFFTYCNKTPLLVDADVASYDESEENVGVPNCKEKSLARRRLIRKSWRRQELNTIINGVHSISES